jgi:type II secretion system protein J
LLSVSVASQDIVKSTTDQTAATGRIASQLGQDFAQVVPRIWRDAAGSGQAAFTGRGSGEGDLMTFLRPAPEGGVQRIVLRRQASQLLRIVYDHPDSDAPTRQSVLADDVTTARARYRHRGAWSDVWYPTSSGALPQAVELVLKREGQAEIRYVFVAGAQGR